MIQLKRMNLRPLDIWTWTETNCRVKSRLLVNVGLNEIAFTERVNSGLTRSAAG